MAKRSEPKPRQLQLPVMVALPSGDAAQRVNRAEETRLQVDSPAREATPQDQSIYDAISAKYLASLNR